MASLNVNTCLILCYSSTFKYGELFPLSIIKLKTTRISAAFSLRHRQTHFYTDHSSDTSGCTQPNFACAPVDEIHALQCVSRWRDCFGQIRSKLRGLRKVETERRGRIAKRMTTINNPPCQGMGTVGPPLNRRCNPLAEPTFSERVVP
jgi:hypothetical protein